MLGQKLAQNRNDLITREKECMELKDKLQDAPKIEELNRWINKVKENEEKQANLIKTTSQLSQDLTQTRERCRRIEHDYK